VPYVESDRKNKKQLFLEKLEVAESEMATQSVTSSQKRPISFSLCIMETPMFNKLEQGLRWLGIKMATVESWFGHNVSGELTSIGPIVSLFNPVMCACVASAGLVI
jgi:hypothetical protein